jgi:L-rhamnose isomerase / sugar isomerase
VEGMDARKMDHAKDMGWMIDASHNVKDPLEDLLQSVEAILVSYAQALLVDRVKLRAAQQTNDVVLAQEILQNSFRTDLRPLVAESRLRVGAALDPLRLYRSCKIREQLIKTRGSKTQSSGL